MARFHNFHPTALREYDIRGIVGATLDVSDAEAVGRGFGSVIRRSGGQTASVGYDGRLSSPELEKAVVRGLRASGCDVLRIGLGPTPMLYYSVHALKADGGIMITGSHNPPDYNGFKMMLANRPFYGNDIQQLGEYSARGEWETGDGHVQEADIRDSYVSRLVEGFSGPALRIGWDCGNGAAGEVVERLIRFLPGEHYTLFTHIDGRFPNHHPDPTVPANLAHLSTLVAEKQLDFGLAFDGDGDRIGAIDSQGRIVWGDQLLAILAEPVLKDEPGATIIADVKASQALFDRVCELGGKPLMWKTGHSLVKAKMQETGSPLAGEMSGHIFFRHRWYGFDDAIYAAVRLIEAVGASGKSLTELKSAMPSLVNTPELRFPCPDTRKFTVIQEVLKRLEAEDASVDATDGARVTTRDGWWLLRASNTQDVLVARAESTDSAGLSRLVAEIDRQLSLSGIRMDNASTDC